MFCGDKPTTREHIFPAWLKAYLPPVPVGVGVVGAKGLRWKLPSFDQQAKLVCGPCNHGWMSRLEALVAPKIGPVVRSPSIPLSLSVDERRILAKWCVKTALVIQAAVMRSKASYAPPDHLRWFADNKDNRDAFDPPPATRVWAFLRLPIEPDGLESLAFAMTFGAAAMRHDSASPVPPTQPDKPEAYITTFAVGYLGFQVVGQDRPVEGQTGLVINAAEMAGVRSRILMPIWPPSGSQNPWPPSLIIGPDDLELLSRWGLDPANSQPVT
jgi:hypothetical protein